MVQPDITCFVTQVADINVLHIRCNNTITLIPA